jgi:hypothetical protein
VAVLNNMMKSEDYKMVREIHRHGAYSNMGRTRHFDFRHKQADGKVTAGFTKPTCLAKELVDFSAVK